MFTKKEYQDRQSEYPNRRKLVPTADPNIYDVQRNEGVVTEQGVPFNADTMNDLESRVEAAFIETSGGMSYTLTHTYDPDTKTHNLTGTIPTTGIATAIYTATSTNAEGDKWTVNGEAYTAKPTGELLDMVSSMFISGDNVSVLVDTTAKKLSFTGGSGGSGKGMTFHYDLPFSLKTNIGSSAPEWKMVDNDRPKELSAPTSFVRYSKDEETGLYYTFSWENSVTTGKLATFLISYDPNTFKRQVVCEFPSLTPYVLTNSAYVFKQEGIFYVFVISRNAENNYLDIRCLQLNLISKTWTQLYYKNSFTHVFSSTSSNREMVFYDFVKVSNNDFYLFATMIEYTYNSISYLYTKYEISQHSIKISHINRTFGDFKLLRTYNGPGNLLTAFGVIPLATIQKEPDGVYVLLNPIGINNINYTYSVIKIPYATLPETLTLEAVPQEVLPFPTAEQKIYLLGEQIGTECIYIVPPPSYAVKGRRIGKIDLKTLAINYEAFTNLPQNASFDYLSIRTVENNRFAITYLTNLGGTPVKYTERTWYLELTAVPPEQNPLLLEICKGDRFNSWYQDIELLPLEKNQEGEIINQPVFSITRQTQIADRNYEIHLNQFDQKRDKEPITVIKK